MSPSLPRVIKTIFKKKCQTKQTLKETKAKKKKRGGEGSKTQSLTKTRNQPLENTLFCVAQYLFEGSTSGPQPTALVKLFI